MPAETIRLENLALAVDVDTRTGAMAIRDKRTGRLWEQKPIGDSFRVDRAQAKGRIVELTWADDRCGLAGLAVVSLPADEPEVLVEVQSAGKMAGLLAWPHPFRTTAGTRLILPMNEGIGYPVDEATIPLTGEITYYGIDNINMYSGQGLVMAFWGIIDDARGDGCLAIVHTPDDASIGLSRQDGLLCLSPQWEPQLQLFGPTRSIRYVFQASGGYVGLCKRYRTHAAERGLVVTLREKADRVPAIDKLVGGVNLWYRDKDPVEMARELQSLGIERMVWGQHGEPEVLTALNGLGVLTSRYDLYHDVMDPANFPYLRRVQEAWPPDAWPDDVALDADGKFLPGWLVTGKDGKEYRCGHMCDSKVMKYARPRIAADLAKHPYQCRFLDVTCATPWKECYHAEHPVTRTQSRLHRMELLKLVAEEHKIVCGSENGHESAVPWASYFEGMLSLRPYRLPRAGYNMGHIWTEPVPERVSRFQMGHTLRLPLWELVYHDCACSHWYWGDYNNKIPALWDKRDLFNVLYGTAPMFMFSPAFWQDNRDRFVQSWRTTGPVARATGYEEMTGHEFLDSARNVQRSTFANGVAVTVNFADQPWQGQGMNLPAGGCTVEGM